jgi:protein SCO1/2
MKTMRFFLSRRLIAPAFFLLLAACAPKPPQFQSMDVTGAQWGQDFSLPDLHGKTTSLADFKGKAVAVFFGFLYCPDACPTHLIKMSEVKKQLGPQAEDVAVVFITVDPERDAPESLAKFLAPLTPNLLGYAAVSSRRRQWQRIFGSITRRCPRRPTHKIRSPTR